MLRARLRAGGSWSDARILNVSSRGLMINAHAYALQPGQIEIWHGDHVIMATVVWQKGTSAGLRSEQRVPVEELMTSSTAAGPVVCAGQTWPAVDRRNRPRNHDRSRLQGKAIEFGGVLIIAGMLVTTAVALAADAFAKPLKIIDSTLAAATGD
jgi:hypothetical protein